MNGHGVNPHRPWVTPGTCVGRARRPRTWHPEHIAERYGLFTLITGQAVLCTGLLMAVLTGFKVVQAGRRLPVLAQVGE